VFSKRYIKGDLRRLDWEVTVEPHNGHQSSINLIAHYFIIISSDQRKPLLDLTNSKPPAALGKQNMASWALSLLPFIFIPWTPPTHGFTTPSTSIQRSRSTQLTATRRNFLTTPITLTALSILSPLPSYAKEKEPITRSLVTQTFASIHEELTSPSGVFATLQKLIDEGNYEDILQYTKESDAFFRKGKLGKARKLLTDDSLKGDSVLMSNAVSSCHLINVLIFAFLPDSINSSSTFYVGYI
jgi:hypothetical protein